MYSATEILMSNTARGDTAKRDWTKQKMMDITSKLRFRIKTSNQTFEAMLDSYKSDDDDIGALYYVVAVVMIYGLSIVMMIASHIRRNNQDNQLRSYLKEMSLLRKNDRRERIFTQVANVSTSAKPLLTKSRSSGKQDSDEIETLQENDDEFNDMRINSNSDETCDSVFQMSCDESPEVVTFYETQSRMCSRTSSAQIQVIDENVPLWPINVARASPFCLSFDEIKWNSTTFTRNLNKDAFNVIKVVFFYFVYTSFLFKYVSDQFMAEKMEIYVPESIWLDGTQRS